MMRKFVLGREI